MSNTLPLSVVPNHVILTHSDTAGSIMFRLRQAGGEPAVLTDATGIDITMVSSDDTKVLDATEMNVEDDTNAVVSWVPVSEDVDTEGVFWAEIAVRFAGSVVDVFPSQGRIFVRVVPGPLS